MNQIDRQRMLYDQLLEECLNNYDFEDEEELRNSITDVVEVKVFKYIS